MTLPSAVKSRDDIPKTLALVITTSERSDFSAVTLRVTNGRSVRDASGNVYASRMLPGASLSRSTGSETAPGAPAGTGMGDPVSPNFFDFSLDNRPDGQDNTLDGYRDYLIQGSAVVVSLGAEYDTNGLPVAVADYEDQGRFYLLRPELGDDTFRFRAMSHEGWQADQPLRRLRYLGLGPHGIDLPGDVTKGVSGTGSALAPTSGYTIGMWVTIDQLPSITGVLADLIIIGDNSTDGFRLRVMTNDNIRLTHYSSTGFSSVLLTRFLLSSWEDDPAIIAGKPFNIVLRVAAPAGGASDVNFYIKGQPGGELSINDNLDDPAAGEVPIGYGLDGKIWQTWVFDEDIGDDLAKEYGAGPLVRDSSMTTLIHLHNYNDWTGSATTVDDDVLATAVQLTLDAGVTFADSREGPDPNFPGIGKVAGGTVPFAIGRRAAFPPVPIDPWDLTWEAGRSGAITIHGGSIDGQPIQIELDYTGVVPMRKTVETRNLNLGTTGATDDVALAVMSLEELAAVAIPEVRSIARAGSRFEVSGHATNNGIYTVVDVRGIDVYVFPDVAATDLSGSCTLAIPATGDPGGWDSSSADGLIVAPEPVAGRLLLNLESLAGEAEPFPTIEDVYALWAWAKDRDDSTAGEIDLEDFDWTPTVDITWVDDETLRLEPLSAGIYTGEDPVYRLELGEALDGCFCWSSNSATVGGLPGVRMGHWHVPAAGGTAYTEAQVVRGSFRELGARPPAWKLTILYRPRDITIQNTGGVLTPAEVDEATLEYSRVEIYRDEAIRSNYTSSVALEWKTPIYSLAGAKRLGQLIRAVVQEERRWWTFVLDVLPGDLEVGEDINVTHAKLPGGAADLMITAVSGTPGLRGASVIGYS